jgi:uncharacterized membrane protein
MRQWLQRVSDQAVENVIGNLLRYGVLLAATVISIGGFIFLAKYGSAHPDLSHFASEPSRLRHVDTIISGAFSLSARGLIQLGLLLLIATPVVRVLFSVFAFAFQRDRLYVVVTLIVLSVLILSLSGA